MNETAFALFMLAGLAYWFTRSGTAGAAVVAPGGGGYIPVPGIAPGEYYPGSAGTQVPYYPAPGGDVYTIAPDDYYTPLDDVEYGGNPAPWINVDDPYAGSYDYDIGGDVTTPSGDPVSNTAAMLALIKAVESNGNYQILNGGTRFASFTEHPYVNLQTGYRYSPLSSAPQGFPPPGGTSTAAGAYQMVVGTWEMAREALGLPDFSPASQDRAAAWILQYKRPRAYPYVLAGNFKQALIELRQEWEAFDKMLVGSYPVSLAQAQEIYEANGGTVA